MDPVCHRCSASLVTSEIFCPHCGAPQLKVEPSDESEAPHAPSRQRTNGQPVILWQKAIAVAVLIALPVGLLSSLLNFSSLWVLAGGFVTVALYRRRSASEPDARMGWCIGVIVGILSAFLSTTFDGLTMVVQRYILHNGNTVDQRIHELAQQMTDQLVQQNPQAVAQIPWFIHFWLSPDGAAAIVLMASVTSALSMILFSAAGGALGGRFLTSRNPARRSS
jgi:hypothetical protein